MNSNILRSHKTLLSRVRSSSGCDHSRCCAAQFYAANFARKSQKSLRIGTTFLLSLIFLFSLTFLSSADDQITPQEGEPVKQDGIVNPKDKFIADEIEEYGKPPEKVIKLKKTFRPPDGFKFRVFDQSEIDYNAVSKAIASRFDIKIKKYWSFWKTIPKYVDIWFDPETALILGSPESIFNGNVINESADKIEVEGYFADANKAAAFPLRCDGNLAVQPGGPGKPPHWSAEVSGGIDLDIDNDNNNGIFGEPNRDLEKEDRWEEADKDDKGKPLFGKYIPVNDGDADDDLIPDFADGFGFFGENGQKIESDNCRFVKAILDISKLEDIINWDKAKIKFKYSASIPVDTEMNLISAVES